MPPDETDKPPVEPTEQTATTEQQELPAADVALVKRLLQIQPSIRPEALELLATDKPAPIPEKLTPEAELEFATLDLEMLQCEYADIWATGRIRDAGWQRDFEQYRTAERQTLEDLMQELATPAGPPGTRKMSEDELLDLLTTIRWPTDPLESTTPLKIALDNWEPLPGQERFKRKLLEKLQEHAERQKQT
jgi:hypothetical protein